MSSLELKVPPPAIAAARRRGHVGAFAFHFTDANADGDAPMDGAGHCAGGRGILHRRRRLVPSCGDDAQSLGAEIDHFIGEFRRLLGHPESHVRGFAVRACRLGDLSFLGLGATRPGGILFLHRAFPDCSRGAFAQRTVRWRIHRLPLEGSPVALKDIRAEDVENERLTSPGPNRNQFSGERNEAADEPRRGRVRRR